MVTQDHHVKETFSTITAQPGTIHTREYMLLKGNKSKYTLLIFTFS